jgi:hypothetical protein
MTAAAADRAPPRPASAWSHPGLRLALLRRWHMWMSVFVAPSLIFFALTGVLQTFRIPDQAGAPVIVQKLARVHKDDVFAVKPPRPKRADAAPGADRRAGPAAAAPGSAPPPAKPRSKPSTEAAKWFFAFASVLMGVTSAVGLWMALAHGRERRIAWALAVAGTLIPVVILAL